MFINRPLTYFRRCLYVSYIGGVYIGVSWLSVHVLVSVSYTRVHTTQLQHVVIAITGSLCRTFSI